MTFSNLKKAVNTKTKDKTIPLKMDKEVFARITLSAQFRKIDMKLVFTYPLGPLPWSIADAYGMPRKTNKATLTKTIVKDIPPVDKYPSDAVSIFDGMAVLLKFQPASNSNFRAVLKSLFNTFTSPISDCIHVIFDVYRNNSISYLERQRQSAGAVEGVQYKNILPSFPVKSWAKVMSTSNNKEEVVKFLVSAWKNAEFSAQLNGRTLYITEGSACWKITQSTCEEILDLKCNHEEADTRMILHAKYANGQVVIHSDETDVFILLLGYSEIIPNSFIKLGKGAKSRIIDIQSIRSSLLQNVQPEFHLH